MAIEKEKIAIYAMIGLVVVGMILYGVYDYYDGEIPAEGETSSISFEAPANNPDQAKREKEKYKSSLDVYEQNHDPLEDEKETVNLGFNKLTEKNEVEEEKPAQSEKTVVYRDRPHIRHSNSYTIINPDVVVKEVQKKEEEEVRTKKKGLITATDNSNNNTAVLQADVSIPVIFHGDQTLVHGGIAKLRTTKACSINGNILQAGIVLSGIVSFDGDYVYININSININGSPTQVALTGFKNGQRGMYAPSNANKDIVKENISNNTSGGVHVAIPGVPISGTINPNLSKKTSEKSASLFVPSQTSLILNPIPKDY